MRHLLATIALGPVLLAQGRHVRRAVPALPEPDGPREGEAGSGKALRLLVLGDSAAAGVGAQTQDEALSGQLAVALAPTFRLHWKLLAFTGATTADMLQRLRAEPAAQFDAVVTSLGVNDVTGRVSLAAWRRAQQELIAVLQSRFGVRHILLSSLPPMHRFPALPQPLRWYVGSRARDFDRVLARVAASRPGCEFLALGHEMMDASAMAGDGFHPGPPIYALWAREATRRIVQRMEQTT
ncbi:MAG: lipase [Rhodocyclales bacterium RIFCSPLOWO2_02_FULL_63_24]|nr:MAG: lipase [Rhodocyclales bacterium GWA2_65_19]OHC68274.1 MAG: lipase [Rhodocyclales bacterium RIFCSPLOWO2_02_FULL_63_24]